MKSFKEYITEASDDHGVLHKFWDEHKDHLHDYHKRDNCTTASHDLDSWMNKKHPGISNGVVPAGHYDTKGNPKKGGFIRVDEPQHGKDDLHPTDKDEMKAKGLDHHKAEDRKKFVSEHPDKEKFHWVPHSWVEADSRKLTGKHQKEPVKLDPSGFHPSGKGQFDKLIKDKKNAQYKEY